MRRGLSGNRGVRAGGLELLLAPNESLIGLLDGPLTLEMQTCCGIVGRIFLTLQLDKPPRLVEDFLRL